MRSGETGAAELVSREATRQNLTSAGDLATAVQTEAKQFPLAQAWGVADPNLGAFFPAAPAPNDSLTDFVVREDNRNKALAALGSLNNTGIQELLRTRNLNNTRVFAPSQSASGQAFDAAVVITGLLAAQEKVTAGLSNDLFSAASQANHGGDPGRLEQSLLDLTFAGATVQLGPVGGVCEQDVQCRDVARTSRKPGRARRETAFPHCSWPTRFAAIRRTSLALSERLSPGWTEEDLAAAFRYSEERGAEPRAARPATLYVRPRASSRPRTNRSPRW